MNYRLLGRTNLRVSEIGIGTWQMTSGGMWVGSDPVESLHCLYRYTDLGGNLIDTAWVYGVTNDFSHHPAEELIGKFLRNSHRRESLILADKVPPKNMEWPAHIGTPIKDVFPKDWIEKCVDESLQSLGVDTIDLMQFHVWQDDWAQNDDWKEAVKKISRSGKVRFWGLSLNDYQPSNCFKTLDSGFIHTVQFIFNIFHQKPTEKLFPYAKEHNIGLIARVPFDEGGLTGKIGLDIKFAPGDFRADYFGGDRRVELVHRLASLRKILDFQANSLPELALRFVLTFPEIGTVIPGMRHIGHVDLNMATSDSRKLPPHLMEELKNHAWERNFYPEENHDPALSQTNYVEA